MPASARSSARSLRSGPKARARGAAAAPEPRLPLVGGATTLADRAARRKHRTRERLLDAALTVFLARGYDAATTAEMARVADLGAGTFYCHFRDKRAAFEGLAQRAARTMMERWTAALAPRSGAAAGVALALEVAAGFWREHPGRARLLLEDGPAFGTAAHLRLVDDLAATLRARIGTRGSREAARMRALAALVVGLAIESGRLVLGGKAREQATLRTLTLLARRAAAARIA